MSFSEIEKNVLNEFGRDSRWRIDFVGYTEDVEEERDASEWCCSDEIKCSSNWDALDNLEMEGYIYCFDDDYYHLTAKGLRACREIFGSDKY